MILCDLPFFLAAAVGAILPLICFGAGIVPRSRFITQPFHKDFIKGALSGLLIIGLFAISPHAARLLNLCDALGPFGYGMLIAYAAMAIALGLIVLLMISFGIIALYRYVRLPFGYARIGLISGLCAGYFTAMVMILLIIHFHKI